MSRFCLVVLSFLSVTTAFAETIPPIYVDDVPSQFGALALRPDGLAFSIGNSPDPRICKHYQGLARVNAADGTPYLIVSRSGNQPGGIGSISCPFQDDDPGNLLIVKLESRDKDGERLRSNRFLRNSPLTGLEFLHTPPDVRDVVVNTIFFDGGAWPNYAHPGGMHVIGDVLVLAMETPYEASLPENLFMFIDVGNPEQPSLLSSWEPPNPGSEFSAGLVGIAPIENESGECCNYVIVATGKANKDVRFYRSVPNNDGITDLRSASLAWQETGRFSESAIESCIPTDWHTGGGDAHQTLNLVREGDLNGPLYMIGLRNDTPLPSGDDRMDLYRIHLDAAGMPLSCPIEFVRSRHFTSYPFMGGGDSANFAAASGVYISPARELIIYAAEFENDGPLEIGGTDQTVRFGEYRHRDMARSESSSLRPTIDVNLMWTVDEGSAITLSGSTGPAKTKAWIQLFEDDNAGSSLPGFGDSDLWLAVDYVDINGDDFDNFTKLSFNDNAGSWRWFAPPGCTIRAYKDAGLSGSMKVLGGTGSVVVEPDLDSIGFDDTMSSVGFDADCASYYAAAIHLAWDLDNSGTFENLGNSVTFDAALLDGPTDVLVPARAEHSIDVSILGRSESKTLTIHVNNVPPSIDSLTAANSLGDELPVHLIGLPLELAASFTDAGVPDTHTASLDWADGTMDSVFDLFVDSTGAVTGQLVHGHTYSITGTFPVELTVTDDDGGSDNATVSLNIVDASEALSVAADLLMDAAQNAANAGIAAALLDAKSWLIGNIDGAASNGAVDELGMDDRVSAIAHLIMAVKSITLAESLGGSDLGAIKGLLGLSAESIANEALAETVLAVSPPSKGQAQQLAKIAALIAQGHTLLVADDFLGALITFKKAVAKAVSLSS